MKLLSELRKITPNHDYAAGLIHPYWARKPINVVEKIIELLSKKNDVIYDPFMGSGTTLLAALKLDRRAIGSDLNPLACSIVDAILLSCEDTEEIKREFKRTCDDFRAKALSLFELDSGMFVERETFDVEGQYENGQFSLHPSIYKIKPVKDGYLKGKIFYQDVVAYKHTIRIVDLIEPIDFESIKFVENTRIAVHGGVTAKHFFTDRNITFINYASKYIDENISSDSIKKILKVFLSSLLPMLRLSDKKASSQWPYWRPKSSLTSRNPIIAINKREKAFLEMFDWVKKNIPKPQNGIVKQGSASKAALFIDTKVDLILTDPPYADHAPYLEYSDLFWSILSGESTKKYWAEEIVKTNAVGRILDADAYEVRMKQTFVEVLKLLKTKGNFVFFYVDKNINHWRAIKEALGESLCEVTEVIGLPKQRRSMKTVASPGKTLDGDLVIVCQKHFSEADFRLKKKLRMEDALRVIPNDGSYFERFAAFIDIYLKNDIVDQNDWQIKDIARIL
ncbi:DNA methyltransferase [Rheinheimera sp. WS51]|uniref:DNA methyltransferase n=1 Tax=Rheinheimera sp. WS51 TaxID=3425886 RepID=UPI003D8E0E73